MTDTEFASWAERLFIAFPSMWEWLQSKSPNPKATQEIWRETLRAYSLAECMGVLNSWVTGKLDMFEPYERDKVHLLVRSIVELARDRQRKKESQNESNRPYHQKRKVTSDGGAIGLGSMMDCKMVAAVKEGAIEHKRFIDGEITQAEYERIKEDILYRHGI